LFRLLLLDNVFFSASERAGRRAGAIGGSTQYAAAAAAASSSCFTRERYPGSMVEGLVFWGPGPIKKELELDAKLHIIFYANNAILGSKRNVSELFPIRQTLWKTRLALTNERRILSIKTFGQRENKCVLVHIFDSSLQTNKAARDI
jgi:hypothetical protein